MKTKTKKFQPWGKVKLQRRKQKTKILLTKHFIIASLLVAGILYVQHWYVNGVIKDVSAQTAEINITKPIIEIDERSLEEHVWDILTNEYNLSMQEKIQAMGIISCESRWNKMAINKNRDGSFDLGLWQINEKYHSIGRDCSFDVYCSTRYAMKLYQEQGWTPWVCSRL
jgi:hypothetical protein